MLASIGGSKGGKIRYLNNSPPKGCTSTLRPRVRSVFFTLLIAFNG